jgi:hypothetical protein
MLTLEQPKQVSHKLEDFDPPLKRKKATVPYYWTLDEIASELGCSIRKVQYAVTGRADIKQPPLLEAYKAGPTFLVPDNSALEYIKNNRKINKTL